MNERIYHVGDLDEVLLSQDLELVKRKKGERRKKGQKDYFDIVCAFDIETSTVRIEEPEKDPEGNDALDENGNVITTSKPHSFMYIWQFQYGPDYTIIGRTWDEYTELLKILRRVQGLAIQRLGIKGFFPLFVVYVHNLGYEWQFLQGVFDFENDDCFFRDVRKPIYCRWNNEIEYRCSYLHSNMALAKFAENVGATVRKLDGEKFDYAKVRFPWTELSKYELQYCINDVRTLVESIRIECEKDGDTLLTLPLTSTGYVRRDVKKALKPMHYSIKQMLPDYDTYMLLRRCFRGGDTHSNRFRTGTIQGAGNSCDIESSYPYSLCVDSYPMGPFRRLEDTDNTIKRIIRLIGVGNAVIADYTFKGLKLRNPKDPFPYIPIAKSKCLRPIEDNGRVLSADLVQIALTEIDLEIILDQYDFYTVSVKNAMTAIKGPLPKAERDVIIEYYTKKTQLKGVAGMEYEYGKSKNKVNACYGMTAQQSIHPKIVYPGRGEDFLKYMPDMESAAGELEKAPFPYQWGVYCTANARRNLRRGMKMIPCDDHGISRAIYCDTDSIKYIGPEIDFGSLNIEIKAKSMKAGAMAKDGKGNLHYMGKWDREPPFNRFITQGAKRYAYEDKEGRLHVTVSGVTKKPHKYYDDKGQEIPEKETLWAVEELGCLENFTEGMTWREAGGIAAVYNDRDDLIYTDKDTGKSVHITPNLSIVDVTYTMTLEQSYSDLLDNCALWLRFCEETGRAYK